MSSYDIFGKFYDAVMGDRAGAAERLSRYIRNASPRAKASWNSVAAQARFEAFGRVATMFSGVDLSSRMLSIAARKVPTSQVVPAGYGQISLE